MVGIIDVGGGMRGIYTAGIYDYLLDHHISIDYCLGVSAGSANLVSFLAGQRGRNRRFYTNYANRREYMSLHNFVTTAPTWTWTISTPPSATPTGRIRWTMRPSPQLQPIYGGGYRRLHRLPRYFTKDDVHPDDFSVVKASLLPAHRLPALPDQRGALLRRRGGRPGALPPRPGGRVRQGGGAAHPAPGLPPARP